MRIFYFFKRRKEERRKRVFLLLSLSLSFLLLVVSPYLYVFRQGLNNQAAIISTIVNISCPKDNEKIGLNNQEMWSGSGFVLYEDGVIATNAHVIPRLNDGSGDFVDVCLVEFSDSETGMIEEMYLATTLVSDDLSDEYDLALLRIIGPYVDSNGSVFGVKDRKFDVFSEPSVCEKESPKLGEKLRVYGYPLIGGGSSITITEGIVSGFPSEGLISTSAKIAHGNSGGIAVNKNGCMLGVPSQIVVGEHEVLGMIISKRAFIEFLNRVNMSFSSK